MGYYTKFKISTKPPLSGVCVGYFDDDYTDENGCFRDDEPVTWYDHEVHFKKISLEYPDTIFIVDGEGESQLDIWRKYFKNGKVQRWVLNIGSLKDLIDPFDESKLEDIG